MMGWATFTNLILYNNWSLKHVRHQIWYGQSLYWCFGNMDSLLGMLQEKMCEKKNGCLKCITETRLLGVMCSIRTHWWSIHWCVNSGPKTPSIVHTIYHVCNRKILAFIDVSEASSLFRYVLEKYGFLEISLIGSVNCADITIADCIPCTYIAYPMW